MSDRADLIDRLAGLPPGSELHEIRRERPEFVEGAEDCRQAVLEPKHGFGLSHALRIALAARMARMLGQEQLMATYEAMLQTFDRDPQLLAIASGASSGEASDQFIAAIVRHVDLITVTPRDSSRADIERLAAAGLSNPQIIALSELIAFVNFEARVIAGLTALREVA